MVPEITWSDLIRFLVDARRGFGLPVCPSNSLLSNSVAVSARIAWF
jgi:hypothetical protein